MFPERVKRNSDDQGIVGVLLVHSEGPVFTALSDELLRDIGRIEGGACLERDALAEAAEGPAAVLFAAAGVRRVGYQAAGTVVKADGGLDLVPALAPGPAGPVGFFAAVSQEVLVRTAKPGVPKGTPGFRCVFPWHAPQYGTDGLSGGGAERGGPSASSKKGTNSYGGGCHPKLML